VYLSILNDEQIEQRIEKLAPNQKEIYLIHLKEVVKRHALFLALTYPEERRTDAKTEVP